MTAAGPRPPDFARIFRAGARWRWSGKGVTSQHIVEAGPLVLPTGRLLACDPFWGSDSIRRGVAPHAIKLRPGRFPVRVAETRWERRPAGVPGRHSDNIAAIMLVLAAEPVHRWQPAWPWKGAPKALTGHRLEVDSGGTGALLDCAALDSLDWMADYDGPIETGVTPPDHLFTDIADEQTDANVIAFESAQGSGAFTTWIGRSTDGAAVRFAVHLGQLHYSIAPIPDDHDHE